VEQPDDSAVRETTVLPDRPEGRDSGGETEVSTLGDDSEEREDDRADKPDRSEPAAPPDLSGSNPQDAHKVIPVKAGEALTDQKIVRSRPSAPAPTGPGVSRRPPGGIAAARVKVEAKPANTPPPEGEQVDRKTSAKSQKTADARAPQETKSQQAAPKTPTAPAKASPEPVQESTQRANQPQGSGKAPGSAIKAQQPPAPDIPKGEAPSARALQSSILGGEAQRAQAAPKQALAQELSQAASQAATKSLAHAVQASEGAQAESQSSGDKPSGQNSPVDALQEALAKAAESGSKETKEIFSAILNANEADSAKPGAAAQPAQANVSPVAANFVQPPAKGGAVAGGAEAAKAPPTQQAVPAARVMQSVIRAARIVVGHGREEIKMLLKPDSLGWLKVKISVEDQKITARFTVEHEGVRELLESNVRQLQQSLQNSNLKVSQVVIELQGGGEADKQAQESADGKHQGSQQAGSAAPEEVSETEHIQLEPEEEPEKLCLVDVRV
jgi:flagellar hook-length control protein FliK